MSKRRSGAPDEQPTAAQLAQGARALIWVGLRILIASVVIGVAGCAAG